MNKFLISIPSFVVSNVKKCCRDAFLDQSLFVTVAIFNHVARQSANLNVVMRDLTFYSII